MMSPPLRGLFVPLLTPLRSADSAVDVRAVAAHVDWLLERRVDGFVALGTTGEFADLDPEERVDLVAATVRAAGGNAPVIAGIGAVGTTEAIAHARRAADAGADAVLCLPPLYWKLGDGGLLRHFAAIADASPVPVVLYDFPSLSGTPLRPALVEQIAGDVEGVVGIKQSGPELRLVDEVLRRVKSFRPDFAVLPGAANLLLPALLSGADGGIVAIANVAPGPVADLLAAVAERRLDDAAAQHRRILAMLAIPALCNPPILALKAAAAACGSPIEAVVRTWPDDPEAIVTRAKALTAEIDM